MGVGYREGKCRNEGEEDVGRMGGRREAFEREKVNMEKWGDRLRMESGITGCRKACIGIRREGVVKEGKKKT